MSTTLVSAENISVSNRLENSTFTIAKGFNVLTGPSGSGKSTAAMVVLGLLHPKTGQVVHYNNQQEIVAKFEPLKEKGFLKRVANFMILESKESIARQDFIRRYCGYIAQNPYLPDSNLTVLQLITNLKSSLGQFADKEKIISIAQKLEIGHNLNDLMRNQSGGEKQRTALVSSIVQQPRLLIADEPTSSLDSRSSKNSLELVRKMVDEDGISVLWITHDRTALEYSDHQLSSLDGVISNSI